MKRKITYLITTTALVMGAFFIGKITAPTVVKTEVISSEIENPDMFNMNTVTDFEATETGLTLYTKDGSGYYWEK
jgi:hypothetical protein